MIKPIPIPPDTIVMLANVNGKLISKSFNYKKMDYKKGFMALQAGFAVKLDKLETVKEAEGIING